MGDGAAEFGQLVAAILRRWWAQNNQPAAGDAEIAAFARRLWAVVNERGLPPPLAPDEEGTPGGMPEPECAPLVAKVVGDLSSAHFTEPARQLIKTCVYPEFRICRDSFRETGSDGICRRQLLAKVRGRLSGAHCVDCPHWIDLAPAEHERYLVAEWCTAPAGFLAHRGVFLPEDFRALRRWLHEWIRTTDH